jgi:hypothetical protein
MIVEGQASFQSNGVSVGRSQNQRRSTEAYYMLVPVMYDADRQICTT